MAKKDGKQKALERVNTQGKSDRNRLELADISVADFKTRQHSQIKERPVGEGSPHRSNRTSANSYDLNVALKVKDRGGDRSHIFARAKTEASTKLSGAPDSMWRKLRKRAFISKLEFINDDPRASSTSRASLPTWSPRN